MGDVDLANCIRLFKVEDDSQTTEQPNPDYYAIIPVREQNIFPAIIHPENDGGYELEKKWNDAFSEEGIDRLIEFRTELEDLFSDCGNVLGIGSILWEEISCRLSGRGIYANGRQCFDKWNSLYSEYLETARSEDERRISSFRNFATFEKVYEQRSKFTNSKIMENVTKFKSEHALLTNEIDSKDFIETCGDGETIKREFTETSQENYEAGDDRVLKEMIKVAENLLDEDLKEEKKSTEELKYDVGKREKRKYVNKRKFQVQDPAWSYFSRGKNRDKLEPREIRESRHVREVDSRWNKINESSEEIKFCWDVDSTQCFVDLRLYVESSPEMKKGITRRYRSIGKFLSQKMLFNGYRISEYDCAKKWTKLIGDYKKEVQKLKTKTVENHNAVSVGIHFYQMDRVLRKSGRLEFADETAVFYWTEESVKTLIGLRIPMENAFATLKRYTILWQYIATQMIKSNFFPTYTECAIKWMELRENYDLCSRGMKIGAARMEASTAEETGWKFFEDMRRAFEQNAKSSESIIEYRETKDCVKKSESIGELEVKKAPVQASTACSYAKISETPTDKEFQSPYEKECLKNGNALNFYRTRVESDECRLEVTSEQTSREKEREGEEKLEDTEISKEKVLNKIDRKTKSNKNFVDSYKFLIDSESKCEKKCNCLKFTWTRDATLSLLGWRLSRKLEFKNSSLDSIDLWKYIAAQMQSVGYDVCYECCKSHWYRLKVIREPDKTACQTHPIESKVPKLLSPMKNANATATRATNARRSNTTYRSSKVKNKCLWDKRMITILIELKFSKGIRELKKYGRLIALKMHEAGYRNITPSDCSNKWISLKQSYNRCLVRKITGKNIRWQYFELMNKHVEDLARDMELYIKDGNSSLDWSPNYVHKLNWLNSSHQGFFIRTGAVNRSQEIVEQPDDFDFAKSKRKANEEFEDGRVVKKLFANTEHVQRVNKSIQVLDKNLQTVGEITALDLSIQVLGPSFEQNSAKNIASIEDLNACKIDNHMDGTKENVACFVLDKNTVAQFPERRNFGKKENTRSRILCDKKSHNEIFNAEKGGNNQTKVSGSCKSQSLARFKYDVPIQERSVNSRQSFRIEKKRAWNDAAIDLLIDLRIEHEEKFPSGYSERSEILWEKIASQMATTGYNFTRAECWQKWCLLRRTYENKITDIEETKVIQTWPYLGKLDTIYKKLEKIYKGFKWILPKKKTRNNVDDDTKEMNLSLPKKLTISVLSSKSCCDKLSIPDTKNEALSKIGACNRLEQSIERC